MVPTTWHRIQPGWKVGVLVVRAQSSPSREMGDVVLDVPTHPPLGLQLLISHRFQNELWVQVILEPSRDSYSRFSCLRICKLCFTVYQYHTHCLAQYLLPRDAQCVVLQHLLLQQMNECGGLREWGCLCIYLKALNPAASTSLSLSSSTIPVSTHEKFIPGYSVTFYVHQIHSSLQPILSVISTLQRAGP